MKQIQLAAAKMDLQLKQLDAKLKDLDLANKPGFWRSVLVSPVFLAAVITVCITGATSFINAQQKKAEIQSADFQTHLDEEKFKLDMSKSILISLLSDKASSSQDLSGKLYLFLNSGLLYDPRGVLRTTAEELSRHFP